MDVIIRNDLFTSYTGLIERVMRTNHRMLCTLSMEMEDIYQELSLAVLRALDSYEEQRATTMDAHVWMTLQCALSWKCSAMTGSGRHCPGWTPVSESLCWNIWRGSLSAPMQSPDAVSPQQRKSCVTSTCPSMW